MNFFPVNFTKFLRTLILHNICERLLLFFPLDLFFNNHHSKEISLCYRLETKVALQSVTSLKKTCFLAFFLKCSKQLFLSTSEVQVIAVTVQNTKISPGCGPYRTSILDSWMSDAYWMSDGQFWWFERNTEQNIYVQKESPRCVLFRGVLKTFAKFTGKHVCWSLFSKAACMGPTNSLKEDSDTGFFQWILRNF